MNPSSLFYEANQFILSETSLYDFFDYLAGQKLDIAQEKPLAQTLKITFKHIDTVPKQLYLTRKFTDKDDTFKPIFLREIKDELKEDEYPMGQDNKLEMMEKMSMLNSTGRDLQPSERKHQKGVILQTGQRKRFVPNSTQNRNIHSFNASSNA